jgi:hypothetical protein
LAHRSACPRRERPTLFRRRLVLGLCLSRATVRGSFPRAHTSLQSAPKPRFVGPPSSPGLHRRASLASRPLLPPRRLGRGGWEAMGTEPRSIDDRRFGSGSEGSQVTLVGHRPVSSRQSIRPPGSGSPPRGRSRALAAQVSSGRDDAPAVTFVEWTLEPSLVGPTSRLGPPPRRFNLNRASRRVNPPFPGHSR